LAPPELIIFDCDGVLVDSEPIANAVLTEGLNELGLDYSLERTQRTYIGRSLKSCIAQIEREAGRAIDTAFWESLQARTFQRFRQELEAVPGIEAVLQALAIPFCVASSGRYDKMNLTLGLTGLLPWFEGRMFSAQDVAHGKPAPDLFLHAAASFAAEPGLCLVVEDSMPGIEAAKAAGMRILGFNRRNALSGVTTFDDMSDLPGLIAG
jgi:HAD superfamily hydrolase (TIGR01509 family)